MSATPKSCMPRHLGSQTKSSECECMDKPSICMMLADCAEACFGTTTQGCEGYTPAGIADWQAIAR